MSMEFYLGLDKHTLATLVLRLSKQNNEWRDIAIALGWKPETNLAAPSPDWYTIHSVMKTRDEDDNSQQTGVDA